MLEKRFAAVPTQVFTANGGADGSVSIADTSLFKVKQQVVITATGQTNLALEVKKVVSPTSMIVGPTTGNINAFTDISAYTTALSASVFANEQKRPQISADDFERAVYEEEPTVAKRMVLVDEQGNKINAANPLPTSATVTVPPITVDTVGQGDPATNADAWPTKISDGVDFVGISTVSGNKALKVDVIQTVTPSTLINPMHVADTSFIAKAATFFYTAGGDIDRIETTIGTKKKIEQFSYTDSDLTGLTVTIEDV